VAELEKKSFRNIVCVCGGGGGDPGHHTSAPSDIPAWRDHERPFRARPGLRRPIGIFVILMWSAPSIWEGACILEAWPHWGLAALWLPSPTMKLYLLFVCQCIWWYHAVTWGIFNSIWCIYVVLNKSDAISYTLSRIYHILLNYFTLLFIFQIPLEVNIQ
jgi:hypothetical protein